MRLSASFVLGYHGCDSSVAEKLLNNGEFRFSENPWDWLGRGIYFWENNPARGLEYATELRSAKKQTAGDVREPAVVGAVVELGYCLDLISTNGLKAVAASYSLLAKDYRESGSGKALPVNVSGKDKLRRNLDCAVINHLHAFRKQTGKPEFDTVRAVFQEEDEAYPGSSFHKKTHIQISVLNPKCIKGVFRVPQEHLQDA